MESTRPEIISKSIANVKPCVNTQCKDADALSLKCENKQDPVEKVKLVTKSNSFRKTAHEKEKAILELKEAITKLENDLKNVQMM